MHRKFLVFLLIVFLFFSFFSSTCEFQLIEIDAHGKQNPDFIIIIIITMGKLLHISYESWDSVK